MGSIMPTNARSPRPTRPTPKALLGGFVVAALRDAKTAGYYPPTVRELFDRMVAAAADGGEVRQIVPDAESFLRALSRAPLKHIGTAFAKDLDAPVALEDDQSLLLGSERLLQSLARRVGETRAAKEKTRGKKPARKTVSAFLKDAKLTGKALQPAAVSVAAYLDRVLTASLEEGKRLPDWLAPLIDVDPDAVAACLVRTIEEASSAQSARPYPVTESALRAMPGAAAILDAATGKSVFFAKVAAIQIPAAGAADRRYLLPHDLPTIALIHLHDALETIGKRFTDTSLFSAEELACEFVAPANARSRTAKATTRSTAKAPSLTKRPPAVSVIAEAIEKAAAKQAIPPAIAWLLDGGTRRYFLRSRVEPNDGFITLRHASTQKSPPQGGFDPVVFHIAFDRAFHELTAASGGRQIVLLSALRKKLPEFTRQQFDDGLMQLWGRAYSLESANERRALSPDDIAAAFIKGGTEYVYVVRRN